MQISDLLAQLGGLDAMASELGISKADAARGAEALLPAVVGGFKKQAQAQPSGLDGLGALVGQLGGADLLGDLLAPKPTDVSRGNDVLGEIFGSRQVSRTVAQQAASETGLDTDLLKKMLPMIAMAVTGLMASQSRGGSGAAPGGGLGGLLGGLLGGGQAAPGGAGSGGLGGLASMLDLDGDGNPLDDILGMVGGGK